MRSILLIPVHRKSRDAGSVDGMAPARPLRFYFTSRETIEIGPNDRTVAVIQELEWRPESSYNSSAQADPVSGIRFSCCNDELFRILVSYNRDRTQGLTDNDLIEGISAEYGTPARPAATISVYSSS